MYDATRKNGTFFRVKKVTAFTHIHKEHFTAAFLCHTDKVMIRALESELRLAAEICSTPDSPHDVKGGRGENAARRGGEGEVSECIHTHSHTQLNSL